MNAKIKSRITCLEKYGVDHYARSEESRLNKTRKWKLMWGDFGKLRNKDWTVIHKNSIKKYKKGELYFDSSWELAYFIYLSDHNIDFDFQCGAYSLYRF